MTTKQELIARADAAVRTLSADQQSTVREILAAAIARGYVTRSDAMFVQAIVDAPTEADLIIDITKGEITERKGGKVFWGLLG